MRSAEAGEGPAPAFCARIDRSAFLRASKTLLTMTSTPGTFDENYPAGLKKPDWVQRICREVNWESMRYSNMRVWKFCELWKTSLGLGPWM